MSGNKATLMKLHFFFFFFCDFCSEPNNESPLNVDAAELWENPAGMS